MTDYNYVVAEYQATPEFKQVVVAPVAAVLPAKTLAGGSPTLNDPIEVLTDGKVVMGFGPIFSNGDNVGMYKLDLANVQPVAQVNTWHALRDAARTACGRRRAATWRSCGVLAAGRDCGVSPQVSLWPC